MTSAVSALQPPARLLMGPGPSNPDPRVLAAMTANPVGHLDPFFVDLMDRTMGALRRVFRTANHYTIPVSGTGTAGLETIVLNLLEPGDSVLVGVIGHFGHRLAELATRSGAEVRAIEAPPGAILDPDVVARHLADRPARLVLLVHAETSTGACQPLREMAEVAHRYGALFAVDCVTSLGGMPVEIDTWGIDAAGSCAQKCLGATPGLGPITVGPAAMAKVRARKHRPTTWYLDLSLLFEYWGEASASRKRAFHHTAPVANIYAFHEALRLLLEEGLEARWTRHQRAHQALVGGVERLGLALFTPADHRLPMINVINVPPRVEEARVRRRLLDMGIEIGGGLGALAGKVWRVGVMGCNADITKVERVLGALEEALRTEGWHP